MSLDLKKKDWGGSLKMAGMDFSWRQIIGFSGIIFWLIILLIRTGAAGAASLATTAQFLVIILVLTAGTRSISLRALFSLFLAGAFMMGLVAIFGKMLGFLSGGMPVFLAVSIVEEFALLLPAVLILWRWRHTRIWTLGASDIFLLFAFCGAGFATVETAYILQARGLDQLSWFRVIAWDGDRIHGYHLFNGHEIWAGIAGLSIGLMWLLKNKGVLVYLLPVIGIALGAIDHFVLDARGNGFIVDALAAVTFNGFLALIVFFAGIICAITIDAKTVYRDLPSYLWCLLKHPIFGRAGYNSLLNIRALAYANHQLESASEQEKPKLAQICLLITNRLDSNL
ncbi:MAG: PrsW family intramembrane metalloprotease [Candidatus Obscuribacterales bacterium]|jgi:hypothetical protein|nr:PrsW family intramembrane metalloprotease [Candidatus Obscuribacterales bacterium]